MRRLEKENRLSRILQVGLVHLRDRRDREGEGRLAPLTRVSFDKAKNQIELENYGIEPVRLTRVVVER